VVDRLCNNMVSVVTGKLISSTMHHTEGGGLESTAASMYNDE